MIGKVDGDLLVTLALGQIRFAIWVVAVSIVALAITYWTCIEQPCDCAEATPEVLEQLPEGDYKG